MLFDFYLKYCIIFTISFIIFTALGTVSHEYGHIVVAKFLGYKTTLHFGSMSFDNPRTTFDLIPKKHDLLITLGGPIQTMLTGIIGFMYLFWRKRKGQTNNLYCKEWVAVFLGLFWLREVFNLLVSVGSEIIHPNGSYFGGDEKIISKLLNLWPGTFSIIFAMFGLIISTWIIFWCIPKYLRLTFIISGFIGGIIGFLLWMNVLGPIIIP